MAVYNRQKSIYQTLYGLNYYYIFHLNLVHTYKSLCLLFFYYCFCIVKKVSIWTGGPC